MNLSLTRQLQRIYNGKAWHGPNIIEGLADLSTAQVLKRYESSHNIAELVHHMYAWRYYIIEQLKGNTHFKVSDDFNFKTIDTIDEAAWEALKQQLADSQIKLMDAIAQFDTTKLQETSPSPNHTYLDLIHGIIQHDLYHLGQIVLLR